MREELVEQVFSTPLWNVEGDSAPATERMRKAAWEFTLNAPYLALGIMTAGAMKMGAVAPFEKMARKRMASEDARQYGQVLKSLGVDNVKDGEVESFLTNLYGTQSPVRSLRMIDKFLDAHGISVTKDGPVVQAMHQAFAEQDRQLHPRDRFLRGLK
ncbi:MAG TPA: hypothetical protein DCS43_03350, partial [Verrucomicrobia bacterium]|nr:hypothetical protein [Verrucomicrobiota bacterium]